MCNKKQYIENNEEIKRELLETLEGIRNAYDRYLKVCDDFDSDKPPPATASKRGKTSD